MNIKERLGLALLLVAFPCALAESRCPDANRFFPAREIGRIRANRMNQLSGMAASRANPDIFWVHNR